MEPNQKKTVYGAIFAVFILTLIIFLSMALLSFTYPKPRENSIYVNQIPQVDSTPSPAPPEPVILGSPTTQQYTSKAKTLDQMEQQMCAAIEPANPSVRATAVKVVSQTQNSQDAWNLNRLKNLYDFMKIRIKYVLDPAGREYFATASETLVSEGGDCDDQAILAVSMMRAVGGRALLAYSTECQHALAFAFVGDYASMQARGNELAELYGRQELRYVYIQTDAGYWIAVDGAGGQWVGDALSTCTSFKVLKC